VRLSRWVNACKAVGQCLRYSPIYRGGERGKTRGVCEWNVRKPCLVGRRGERIVYIFPKEGYPDRVAYRIKGATRGGVVCKKKGMCQVLKKKIACFGGEGKRPSAA